MILEEDEVTRSFKHKEVEYLRNSINRVFIRMVPIVLLFCALIYRVESDESIRRMIWGSSFFVYLLLFAGIRLMIFSVGSTKQRWRIEDGRIKRKGEFNLKLKGDLAMTGKQLDGFEGYYSLNVKGIQIILNEERFPRNAVMDSIAEQAAVVK